uniref:alpha-L-fucosidase n=1 Tax=Acrobeloides nanus TaxID=290746 RepID=A0A914ER20_9BILA
MKDLLCGLVMSHGIGMLLIPVKDTVVVNDRWGKECRCKHGGYYSCNDRFFPGTLQHHKWEDNDTVDKYSWGYRRTMRFDDTQPLSYLISRLVIVIATGGNYLVNIGPDANGRILPIFEERLRDLGSFVNTHSEAIFATKPWIYQNDSATWYTSQVRNNATLDPYRLYNNQTQANTIIYAFALQWPDDNLVNLTHVIPTSNTTVNLFSTKGFIQLPWTQPFALGGGIQVNISSISLVLFPCKEAFAFKIEYAADQNAPSGLDTSSTVPSAVPPTTASNGGTTNNSSTSSAQNNPGSSPSTQAQNSTTSVPKSAIKINSGLVSFSIILFYVLKIVF